MGVETNRIIFVEQVVKAAHTFASVFVFRTRDELSSVDQWYRVHGGSHKRWSRGQRGALSRRKEKDTFTGWRAVLSEVKRKLRMSQMRYGSIFESVAGVCWRNEWLCTNSDRKIDNKYYWKNKFMGQHSPDRMVDVDTFRTLVWHGKFAEWTHSKKLGWRVKNPWRASDPRMTYQFPNVMSEGRHVNGRRRSFLLFSNFRRCAKFLTKVRLLRSAAHDLLKKDDVGVVKPAKRGQESLASNRRRVWRSW